MNTASLNFRIWQIGQMLRLYRENKGQNLVEVASQANISVSMLSQIERGKVMPSIDTLLAVCEALGFDVVDLFRRISQRQNVTVRHERERLITERHGVCYEQLIKTPEGSVPAELLKLEVAPGMTVGLSSEGHEGTEIGYVLSGAAKLTVGSDSYDLNAGDSIAFYSHIPHTLANYGTKSFTAIWSAIPPHRDYLEPDETNQQNALGNNDECQA